MKTLIITLTLIASLFILMCNQPSPTGTDNIIRDTVVIRDTISGDTIQGDTVVQVDTLMLTTSTMMVSADILIFSE